MKRKQIGTIDIKYTVIETIAGDGTFVQFMPELWLIPSSKNVAFKKRDCVQFYFPIRVPGQSIDSHLKFVKHAKFIGMKPIKDGKWELSNGRILKLGLGLLFFVIN